MAEVIAVTQPESVLGRANAEHWAGRLYMRKVSPYLTRELVRTSITPYGVTWLMVVSGLLAALALASLGVVGAVLCVLLIQAQLLFDCSDGEVARWRRHSSPVGIYLDRIGHYSTESALPIALGIKADGGWTSIGGWTTLGLVCAVLHLLNKAETDLVHVARAYAGLPLVQDVTATSRPRGGLLALVRGVLRFVPFFRAFVAVEFSFLVLVAALFDVALGDLVGSRVLVVALVPIGVVIAGGHLLGVLTSSRLKA